MNPIPKKLLIHSVILKSPGLKNAWGDSDELPVNLDFVRLEPCHNFMTDRTQQQVQLQATLFYDCTYSMPKGFLFKQGQSVLFESETYQIVTVEKLYDGTKLHHIEVGIA